MVLPDAQALADAVAQRIVAAATNAIEARGRFVLALSGGATPQRTFERLAEAALSSRMDWTRVHVVWGDERCVPPDDAASNYRLARSLLLDHVPVRPEHVHRILGELDAPEAAARYEMTLRALLDTPVGPPRTEPGARIDFVLLGLGPDGHTASLFPGSPGIGDLVNWAIPARANAAPAWRVSLTRAVINAAGEVAFVVSGAAKAEVLRRVLEGHRRQLELPAQAINPSSGSARWYVDADAAAMLSAASLPPARDEAALTAGRRRP